MLCKYHPYLLAKKVHPPTRLYVLLLHQQHDQIWVNVVGSQLSFPYCQNGFFLASCCCFQRTATEFSSADRFNSTNVHYHWHISLHCTLVSTPDHSSLNIYILCFSEKHLQRRGGISQYIQCRGLLLEYGGIHFHSRHSRKPCLESGLLRKLSPRQFFALRGRTSFVTLRVTKNNAVHDNSIFNPNTPS